MSKKPKYCPFCGSEKIHTNMHFHICITCDAQAPEKTWNNRVPHPKIKYIYDKLSGFLDQLKEKHAGESIQVGVILLLWDAIKKSVEEKND